MLKHLKTVPDEAANPLPWDYFRLVGNPEVAASEIGLNARGLG